MFYENVELHNVEELLEKSEGQGRILSRLPDTLRVQLNENAKQFALQTAGCEIRFNLAGDSATAVLRSPERPTIVEVYQGSLCTGWHVIGEEPTELVIERPPASELVAQVSRDEQLPFDPQLTRLLLPWNATTRLLALDGALSPPRPEQAPRRKYLAYGSSITQGYTAICPGDPYPHRIAYLLGADAINLGFAGGAHLEPAIADYIAARRDWDFATLEMGINLVGGIATQEFERRVRTFVETIAGRHPDKWIFCIDLFTCSMDFAHEPKIAEFRQVVQAVVSEMALPRLVHLSGAELLTSAQGLTHDLLHPARSGMEEIARNLAASIASRLGGAR